MKPSERRYSPRFGLKIPLVFSAMHSPLTTGHQAKSINISMRGVYFVTNHPVFVGLPVRVLLRMPKRITGRLPSERVFAGRVSHVEAKDPSNSSSGVGVEFFYWENSRESASTSDAATSEDSRDNRMLFRR